MSTEIIMAFLSFVGTLVGSMGGVIATSKLTSYRIEMLEKKVDKHNSLVERMYKIEEAQSLLDNRVRVSEHRIEDLEKGGISND